MRLKRTKKAPRAKKPARSIRSKKSTTVVADATNHSWITSSRAIVSGMIFVVVAAALLTAREDATPMEDAAPTNILREASPVAAVVQNGVERPSEATKTVAIRATAVKADAPRAMAQTIELEREPHAEAAAEPEPQPQPQPESESATSTTITGCLERGEGTFRLTDASGTDAPTSRSWKSGFLKRRPAHIDLADGVGTLNLRNLVGRRVSATGTLAERELRARSVRPVGTCD